MAQGTLVDSNVLLDVLTEDETWYRTYFPTVQLTAPHPDDTETEAALRRLDAEDGGFPR